MKRSKIIAAAAIGSIAIATSLAQDLSAASVDPVPLGLPEDFQGAEIFWRDDVVLDVCSANVLNGKAFPRLEEGTALPQLAGDEAIKRDEHFKLRDEEGLGAWFDSVEPVFSEWSSQQIENFDILIGCGTVANARTILGVGDPGENAALLLLSIQNASPFKKNWIDEDGSIRSLKVPDFAHYVSLIAFNTEAVFDDQKFELTRDVLDTVMDGCRQTFTVQATSFAPPGSSSSSAGQTSRIDQVADWGEAINAQEACRANWPN